MITVQKFRSFADLSFAAAFSGMALAHLTRAAVSWGDWSQFMSSLLFLFLFGMLATEGWLRVAGK